MRSRLNQLGLQVFAILVLFHTSQIILQISAIFLSKLKGRGQGSAQHWNESKFCSWLILLFCLHNPSNPAWRLGKSQPAVLFLGINPKNRYEKQILFPTGSASDREWKVKRISLLPPRLNQFHLHFYPVLILRQNHHARGVGNEVRLGLQDFLWPEEPGSHDEGVGLERRHVYFSIPS